MKNPCRDCSRLSDNKNDPICMQCNLRVEYVRSLGGANDMQPLLGLNGGGQSPTVGADYDAGKDYKEMENEKICSKADCKHGGKPQPLDEFDKAKGVPLGYCKSCRRKLQREKGNGGKRKYTKKAAPPEIVQWPAKPLSAINPYIITIDLSETPEIYHKLAEREAIDIIMNALR